MNNNNNDSNSPNEKTNMCSHNLGHNKFNQNNSKVKEDACTCNNYKTSPDYAKRASKYQADDAIWSGMANLTFDDRIRNRVNNTLSGPTHELPECATDGKKFTSYSRLFVGSLPKETGEDELKELFIKFGELGQIYYNKEGSYAFINFGCRSNAEQALRELNGTLFHNRPLQIRFAAISNGIRVLNLSPFVSNELLELAFSVFGPIENCKVIVDERGNSLTEGIVVFSEKKSAVIAVKKCQEEPYILTNSARPVIAMALETKEQEEGLPERIFNKSDWQYRKERAKGPRFPDPHSVDYMFSMRYKRLYQMYHDKKDALEKDLMIELNNLDRAFEAEKRLMGRSRFHTQDYSYKSGGGGGQYSQNNSYESNKYGYNYDYGASNYRGTSHSGEDSVSSSKMTNSYYENYNGKKDRPS